MNKKISICIIAIFLIGCGKNADINSVVLTESKSRGEINSDEDIFVPFSISITDIETDSQKVFLQDENKKFVEKMYKSILADKSKTKEKSTNAFLIEVCDFNSEPTEVYYINKSKENQMYFWENIFVASDVSMTIRKNKSKDKRIVLLNPDDYYKILEILNCLSQTEFHNNSNSSNNDSMVLEVGTSDENSLYNVTSDYEDLYSLLTEHFDSFLIPLS